ncbi:MAG: hypothetical protein NC201_06320 [Prevotella sp.]|nr:hypothetical protein [Bacteroides sp.]MCM1366846.1 hypothetical protein [Prevotella sp.]MCM1437196.1 hypothetical protein [Prevotella sp.]
MEIVAIIIMILVGFSFMLKLTYLPTYGRVVICVVCALFVGMNWNTATEQSKTQIADWLQNPELMLDVAILLTIDVCLQITFCIMESGYIFGENLPKAASLIRKITLWIPGILLFIALYALLVEVVFLFPGADFKLIAWTLAFAFFAVGTISPGIIKWGLPEKDLRLEIIFMINAMIALLGIVATVNGRTAVTGTNTVEWQPLLSVIILLMVGSFAGLLLFKRNNNKKLSKIK